MNTLIRRTLLRLPALGWFWMSVASPQAFAHGDLHGLIQNVTREIEQAPRNPELYLRRAEWHRAHEGWDAALADIERATALTNQYHVLHLARARVYLDAGWFESAKVTADRFLVQEPNNAEALQGDGAIPAQGNLARPARRDSPERRPQRRGRRGIPRRLEGPGRAVAHEAGRAGHGGTGAARPRRLRSGRPPAASTPPASPR